MIVAGTGDLLDRNVEALVNAVNTVGVMDKGLALAMKHAFPDNFAAYRIACKAGSVEAGRMSVTRIEDIDAGLADLVRVLPSNGIRSIAIPALGCGLGGLDWEVVRPRIVSALDGLDGLDAEIRLFPPR